MLTIHGRASKGPAVRPQVEERPQPRGVSRDRSIAPFMAMPGKRPKRAIRQIVPEGPAESCAGLHSFPEAVGIIAIVNEVARAACHPAAKIR
jgi:hypothetical protein